MCVCVCVCEDRNKRNASLKINLKWIFNKYRPFIYIHSASETQAAAATSASCENDLPASPGHSHKGFCPQWNNNIKAAKSLPLFPLLGWQTAPNSYFLFVLTEEADRSLLYCVLLLFHLHIFQILLSDNETMTLICKYYGGSHVCSMWESFDEIQNSICLIFPGLTRCCSWSAESLKKISLHFNIHPTLYEHLSDWNVWVSSADREATDGIRWIPSGPGDVFRIHQEDAAIAIRTQVSSERCTDGCRKRCSPASFQQLNPLHGVFNWLLNSLSLIPMPLYDLHKQMRPTARRLAISIHPFSVSKHYDIFVGGA